MDYWRVKQGSWQRVEEKDFPEWDETYGCWKNGILLAGDGTWWQLHQVKLSDDDYCWIISWGEEVLILTDNPGDAIDLSSKLSAPAFFEYVSDPQLIAYRVADVVAAMPSAHRNTADCRERERQAFIKRQRERECE